MVGEIITVSAVVAAVAKPAFDYLKVRVLAKSANKADIPEIAKCAFPRYRIGPLRRGIAEDEPGTSDDGEPLGGQYAD